MSKRRRLKLRGIDYLMLSIITVLILAWPIMVVYSKSTLSKSNIEVERMRLRIQSQEIVNEGLTMKVNELASLTNIQGVARQHGISYNNDNIIVIAE